MALPRVTEHFPLPRPARTGKNCGRRGLVASCVDPVLRRFLVAGPTEDHRKTPMCAHFYRRGFDDHERPQHNLTEGDHEITLGRRRRGRRDDRDVDRAEAITAGTDVNWSTIGKDFITTTPTRVVDTNTGLNGISGSVAANHICGVNLSAVTPAGAQGNRVFFSW